MDSPEPGTRRRHPSLISITVMHEILVNALSPFELAPLVFLKTECVFAIYPEATRSSTYPSGQEAIPSRDIVHCAMRVNAMVEIIIVTIPQVCRFVSLVQILIRCLSGWLLLEVSTSASRGCQIDLSWVALSSPAALRCFDIFVQAH